MKKTKQEAGILRAGHILGIKYAEGWWFNQILETEFIELKPWILLNENENRDVIAANTAGSEDDEIRDTLDRNYILPDDQEQNLIFQIQFGVAPSRMQIYPFFGRDRSPNLEGNAEPGEPQVPLTGFDSPYNNPSEQSEIFTINQQEFPSLQAYNPMQTAEEARVSFHVNKMKYATIEDKGVMKAILQGNQPAKLHSAGLGAQRRDQLSVPSWLNDHFGENIHSTEEILNANEDSNGNGGDGVSLPGRSMS